VHLCAQEKLEGAEARGTIQASTSLSRDMHSKLRELSKLTQQIESQWRILVVQENASKRDLWKRKVEQVVEDCDQFRVALGRFKGRVSETSVSFQVSQTVSESSSPSLLPMPQESRRQAEEKDRDELMQRVTSDDEFRLLVSQYDAEAGAKSALNSYPQTLSEDYTWFVCSMNGMC